MWKLIIAYRGDIRWQVYDGEYEVLILRRDDLVKHSRKDISWTAIVKDRAANRTLY